MPSRGATFLSDGFVCHGAPIVSALSVTFRRLEILPFASVGVVTNSYRTPRFIVRFGRQRMSFCAKKPQNCWR